MRLHVLGGEEGRPQDSDPPARTPTCPPAWDAVENEGFSQLPEGVPSSGSVLHATGQCRPCAWFHKPQGCFKESQCLHCHLCDEDTIKRRKNAKQRMRAKCAEEGEGELLPDLVPGPPEPASAAGGPLLQKQRLAVPLSLSDHLLPLSEPPPPHAWAPQLPVPSLPTPAMGEGSSNVHLSPPAPLPPSWMPGSCGQGRQDEGGRSEPPTWEPGCKPLPGLQARALGAESLGAAPGSSEFVAAAVTDSAAAPTKEAAGHAVVAQVAAPAMDLASEALPPNLLQQRLPEVAGIPLTLLCSRERRRARSGYWCDICGQFGCDLQPEVHMPWHWGLGGDRSPDQSPAASLRPISGFQLEPASWWCGPTPSSQSQPISGRQPDPIPGVQLGLRRVLTPGSQREPALGSQPEPNSESQLELVPGWNPVPSASGHPGPQREQTPGSQPNASSGKQTGQAPDLQLEPSSGSLPEPSPELQPDVTEVVQPGSQHEPTPDRQPETLPELQLELANLFPSPQVHPMPVWQHATAPGPQHEQTASLRPELQPATSITCQPEPSLRRGLQPARTLEYQPEPTAESRPELNSGSLPGSQLEPVSGSQLEPTLGGQLTPRLQPEQTFEWQLGAEEVKHDMICLNVGSLNHGSDSCQPCAWFWKPVGCKRGLDCNRCHLCPNGTLKALRRERLAKMRAEDVGRGDVGFRRNYRQDLDQKFQ
eukprot:TRINITY_DN78027_c0_g1_i1.p1 TRINITY_DN78027_c0_g1~~TRINITY_DN78027_c0_g1_i1.p1  ORF type:complete len:705 (+),score=109.01 TRINITY_DN78027_c0_g1_i1:122-2236(+)